MIKYFPTDKGNDYCMRRVRESIDEYKKYKNKYNIDTASYIRLLQ